jgi:hypothetical protein
MGDPAATVADPIARDRARSPGFYLHITHASRPMDRFKPDSIDAVTALSGP